MPRPKKHVSANRRNGQLASASILSASSTAGDRRGEGLSGERRRLLFQQGFTPLESIGRKLALEMARVAMSIIENLGGHVAGNQVLATPSQRAFIVVSADYHQRVRKDERVGLIDCLLYTSPSPRDS